LSLEIVVVTNATVATRIPQCSILDQSSNFVCIVPAPAGQGASLTLDYSWFPTAGSAVGAVGAQQFSPWPDVYIPAGFTIRTALGSGQAGDNISSFTLLLEFVPTGPEVAPSRVIPPIETEALGLAPSGEFLSTSSVVASGAPKLEIPSSGDLVSIQPIDTGGRTKLGKTPSGDLVSIQPIDTSGRTKLGVTPSGDLVSIQPIDTSGRTKLGKTPSGDLVSIQPIDTSGRRRV